MQTKSMQNNLEIKIRWSIFPTLFMFLGSGGIIGICWFVFLKEGFTLMIVPAILTLFFPGAWFFGILLYPNPVTISSTGFSIFNFYFAWNEVNGFRITTTYVRGIKQESVIFSYSDTCKVRLNELSLPKRVMWIAFSSFLSQSKEKNYLSFPYNLKYKASKLLETIEIHKQSGNAA